LSTSHSLPAGPRSNRIAGLAAFAATTCAVAVAVIATLDRVGAPGPLVRAIGPVLALIAIAVFGLGARTATLATFAAAGRRVPPAYCALSFAAVASGAALVLGPRLAPAADAIWFGVLVGIGLGGLAIGPLVRRFGAASVSDVIATVYPSTPIRLASALLVWAAAALTALAGFRLAIATVESLVITNHVWAETVVASVIFVFVAPGGLSSLIWSASATGVGLVMIALIGWLVPGGFEAAPASAAAASALAAPALTWPAAVAEFVAAALASAFLFAPAPTAVACRDTAGALRAGAGGGALFAALAAAAMTTTPVFEPDRGLAGANPVAVSLLAAATLASALALASAGVQGAARALGLALAQPPRPFPTLASIRLARMRVAAAVTIAACAVIDDARLVDAATALILAMALLLAFTAPLVALAATGRAGPLAAAAGLATALAAAATGRGTNFANAAPAELLDHALQAAAAAFVVGSLVAAVLPRREPPPAAGEFDPFSEASG
jgi:cation/acetate symporter